MRGGGGGGGVFCKSTKATCRKHKVITFIKWKLCYISIIKVWVSDKQGLLQTKIKVWSLDSFEEYIKTVKTNCLALVFSEGRCEYNRIRTHSANIASAKIIIIILKQTYV